MRKRILLFVFTFLAGICIQAQVAINTDGGEPDGSAMLDVQSTEKGMLIPRLTTVERTAIATPATGLMVYDTDESSFYFYNGSEWGKISAGADTLWTLSGDNLLNSNVGNVGIGTLSPEEKLQVGGNLYLRGGSTWATGEKFTIGSSEPLIEIRRPGNSRRMLFESGINQPANGGFDFSVDSSTKMVLDYQGNLGIGTTNPSSKLEVINGRIKVQQAVGNEAYAALYAIAPESGIGIYQSGINTKNYFSGRVGIGITSPLANLHVAQSGPNPAIYITDAGSTEGEIAVPIGQAFDIGHFNIADSSYTSRIQIESSGQVGIGTTSPAAPLHVSGTGNHKIIVESTDDNEAQYELKSTDSRALLFYRHHDNDFGIWFQGRPEYNGTVFRLDGNGDILLNGRNVGIGTSSPDDKLHVVGNIVMEDGNEADGKVLISDANGKAEWGTLEAGTIFGFNPEPSFECMTEMGSLGVGDWPASVAVSGDYAYVVIENSGTDYLKVIDISDPASPSLEGSLAIGPGPKHVCVSGNYAYVIDDDDDDLKVIDISNPSSPSLEGSIGFAENPRDLDVAGSYAYVVSGDDLVVINVSNPSSPSISGSVDTELSTPNSVSISGNFAYVVGYYVPNRLKIIDISTPSSPSVVGSYDISGQNGNTYKVVASGDYAYVQAVSAGYDPFVVVVDVSIPASPSHEATLNFYDDALIQSMYLSGNYIYLTDSYNDALKIVKVSDPSSPVLEGSFGIGTWPTCCVVEGEFAYVTDTDGDELMILDLMECQGVLAIEPDGSLVSGIPGWQQSNNDIFNTNSGNIGIGTNTPDANAKLHIIDGRIRVEQAEGNEAYACLYAITPEDGTGIYQAGVNSENYFQGEVGIGDPTPNYPLDVEASRSGAIASFYNSYPATGGDGIRVVLNNTAGGGWGQANNFLTFKAIFSTSQGAIKVGEIELYNKAEHDFNAMWSGSNWEDIICEIATNGVPIWSPVALTAWLANQVVINNCLHGGVDFSSNPAFPPVFSSPDNTGGNHTIPIDSLSVIRQIEANKAGIHLESTGKDYAEYMEKEFPAQRLTPGTVVGVKNGKISKITRNADKVMAISLAPVVIGNMVDDSLEHHLYEKVAFIGQVPVWVFGKVRTGDFIVASGWNDGKAIAVAQDDLKLEQVNQIVGRAWESSDSQAYKLVNTVVGIDSDEVTHILKRQQDRIDELEEKLNRMSELEERLAKVERFLGETEEPVEYTQVDVK